jgi:hypothetical protein
MKEALILASSISFLILLGSAYACVRMPEATLAEECLGYGIPSFSPVHDAFGNKTIIIERLQQYKNYTYPCGIISLTDNNIETISDFLSNGYSTLRQTQEEYQIFLENANKVNNNLSTCDYYSAVVNKNGWTGYIFNDESEKTVACAQAPRKLCGGGSPTNILWNDLKPLSTSTTILATLLDYWWLFIIIIAITLIGITYNLKRNKKFI